MARNRWTVAIACIGVLAIAVPARPSRAAMRVVVRVSSARDMAVAQRLRGQASDLPVALVLTRRPPEALHVQAGDAAALAEAAGARATVWFARVSGPSERYLVFVSLAGAQEPSLLARLLLPGGRLTSGGLETAALVARTALQALLLGEAVQAIEPAADERPAVRARAAGAPARAASAPRREAAALGGERGFEGRQGPERDIDPREVRRIPEGRQGSERDTDPREIRRGPEGGAGPREARRGPEEPEVPRNGSGPEDREGRSPGPRSARVEDRALTAPIHLFFGLQQAVADGTGALGRSGLRLRVAVQVAAFELGIAGALSLPATVGHPLGDLRIARHDAQGSAAVRLGGEPLSLWLGARAGLALFHRQTRPDNGRLTATGTRLTPALLLGPWLEGAWMSGPIGLGVQVALDVLPDGPRFVYDGAGAPDAPVHRPPVVVPQLSAGLQMRFL